MTRGAEVSVVIPTRGGGRGLDRAISSVIDQEDVATRLIVVVDGDPSSATDRSALAGLRSPHRVITVSRIGIPGALRNLGLGLVRTRHVAFLDDDDWWDASKLRKQMATLEQSGCALVGSNAIKVLNGEPIGLYFERMPSGINLDDLLASNWLITSSVVVVADVLRAVGGFPSEERLRSSDDYAGWLKAAAVGGVTVTSEPLVRYTVDGSESVSSADPLSGAETRRLALEHLLMTQRHWNVRLSRRQRALVKRFTEPGN